jgi:plastocyanin
MHRGTFLLAAVVLSAGLEARADQSVQIGPGLSFSPANITIAPGEKVTWSWAGSPHSTTSDATSGPEVWDSGIQVLGSSFSHTFTTPGTYPYYCKVHSFPGGTMMNGSVTVAALTPTPTITGTPTSTPTITRTFTPAPATPTPGPAATPTPIAGSGSIPTLSPVPAGVLGALLAGTGILVLFGLRRR